MATYILEIGSEEIPSRFLEGEERDIEKLFKTSLSENGLPFSSLKAMATPRRLTLRVDGIAPIQEEREEVIMGPPVNIAYDEAGNPTRAFTGFLNANNIAATDVYKVFTSKGDYIACTKKTGGKSAREILAEITPGIISSIPFAKSMRWGNNDISHARPIRWILALLDSEIVPFKVGPITSGRHTSGHRIHGAGPFEVPDTGSYEKIISDKCSIILEPDKRRDLIVQKGNELAARKGGEIIWIPELLEEVGGLVEHPVPILADFDPKYLEIPSEVLLTSMQSHQKSFGLRGKDGRLLPYFLTILNISPENVDVVRKGWERVLRARLEDARFFWQADLQASLDEWLAKLEKVIFIGPLGSMADKSRRLEKLCGWLAGQLNPPANVALAERAGKLAKADLVSSMVGEFDTLQGIMGGIYAENFGENPEVANAIREQYLPAGPDSLLPDTLLGAILSICDRADTLAGCFGLNMIPTGMADPNGLRRCALGIIRIMLARNIEVSPMKLIGKALDLYKDINWKLSRKDIENKLQDFFLGRLRNYFINKGYSTVLVDAVLANGISNIPDSQAKLDAIVAFSNNDNYEKSLQTLKRVENISKKETIADNNPIDETLLTEAAEKRLASDLSVLLPRIDTKLSEKDYIGAIAELENLAPPVNDFFDNIMVLCDNPALRANRLKLLKSIADRYSGIARFASLQ